MKHIFLTTLALFFSYFAFSQSYYVLHVNGEIYKADESPLAEGDMIEGNMSLVFGNNEITKSI